MKTIFTLLLFVASFTTTAQTYTEMQVPNVVPMETMSIEIEQNEAYYILNNNSAGASFRYILINKVGLNYTTPIVPTGWSLQVLYKPNTAILNFTIGSMFTIVIDNNGCSYMRIH